jgi:hypothetical protein
MRKLAPRDRLAGVVGPHWPKTTAGRPSLDMETKRRIVKDLPAFKGVPLKADADAGCGLAHSVERIKVRYRGQ